MLMQLSPSQAAAAIVEAETEAASASSSDDDEDADEPELPPPKPALQFEEAPAPAPAPAPAGRRRGLQRNQSVAAIKDEEAKAESPRAGWAEGHDVQHPEEQQQQPAAAVAEPAAGAGAGLTGMAKIRAMEAGVLGKKMENHMLGRLKVARARMQQTTALRPFADFTFDEIFELVRRDLSSFNWMLCKADPALPTCVHAGSGSIPEMISFLDSRQVLYGYIRLGFGSGLLRRTKWAFFRWSGEDVPAMERGRLNAVEEAMQLLLSPHHLKFVGSCAAEVQTAAVLERISGVIKVDNSEDGRVTVDMLLEGLAEERELVGAKVRRGSHGCKSLWVIRAAAVSLTRRCRVGGPEVGGGHQDRDRDRPVHGRRAGAGAQGLAADQGGRGRRLPVGLGRRLGGLGL